MSSADGPDSEENDERAQQLEELLKDPKTRDKLRSRLGVKTGEASESSHSTPSGKLDSSSAPPTPSGKNGGDGPPGSSRSSATWWPHGAFPPYFPFPLPLPAVGGSSSSSASHPWPFPFFPRSQQPPSRRQTSQLAAEEEDAGSETEESATEDRVDLLSEAEALELVEFDPTVEPEDSWAPSKAMESFIEKHFNRSLTPSERKAIMKDFPKPTCKALEVPRLDEQVKDHLKGKGKDPHFGQEKSLFKLQEAVLDVAGPLTCLWGDLLNEQARVSTEDILMLIQRSLVLLGSASHAISQERRKVAWARINPKLKSLAEEDYGKRDGNLFGPGFLEKASKRLERDKTIAKVSQPANPPSAKRARYSRDGSDLRSFLAKGATARYGGGRSQRPQPYQPPRKFQSRRYFQHSRATQESQKSPKSKQD